jgi:peptidoglycan/LPS O-acetylase OafA/YrhL
MNAPTGYVIVVAAILLVLAALTFWRRRDSKRVPLIVYMIGVAVVWAVLLAVMWFLGDIARFQTFALVCFGFALGMLAMYIAVHVYKS